MVQEIAFKTVMENAPGFELISDEIQSILEIARPNNEIAFRAIKKVSENILSKVQDRSVYYFMNDICGRGPIYASVLDSIVQRGLVDALTLSGLNGHPLIIPKSTYTDGRYSLTFEEEIESFLEKIMSEIPQLRNGLCSNGKDKEKNLMLGICYNYKIPLL